MKKLRYVVWFLLLVALAVSVLTTYTLIQQQASLKQNLKDIIALQIHSEISSIPIPKDGVDGKDATPEQISQAVSNYMAQNPVRNGKDGTNGLNGQNGQNATDTQVQQVVNNYLTTNPIQSGKDGLDGKTPQIRCNAIVNRWEVRYSDDEKWQALNGQNVKCSLN